MDQGKCSSLAFLTAAALAGTVALPGCVGAPVPEENVESGDVLAPDGTEEAAKSDPVAGTLLYKLELGVGHTIEYYELDIGHLAARENMPIGGDGPVLNRLADDEPLSLAAIYRVARPDAEIPEEVLRVDALYPQEPKGVAERSPTIQATSENVTANGTVGVLPTAALSDAAHCSGDELDDNWGAQWFLDNYCQGGNERWCQTNRTGGFIEVLDTRLIRWSVMAADFFHGATIRQSHRCRHTDHQWSTREEHVPFRSITTWIIDEGGWKCFGFPVGWCGQPLADIRNWAIGSSSCERVHYAARWM